MRAHGPKAGCRKRPCPGAQGAAGEPFIARSLRPSKAAPAPAPAGCPGGRPAGRGRLNKSLDLSPDRKCILFVYTGGGP